MAKSDLIRGATRAPRLIWRGVASLVLCAGLALASTPAHADAARFSAAVDDLPLMDGLVEDAASPFETAHGRIVRIETHGPVDAAEVAVFYARTLPALGWRASEVEPLAFHRAGERLGLMIEPLGAGQTRVTFQIQPTAAYASRR